MDNRALFCKNVEDALDQELTERYGEEHEINGMPAEIVITDRQIFVREEGVEGPRPTISIGKIQDQFEKRNNIDNKREYAALAREYMDAYEACLQGISPFGDKGTMEELDEAFSNVRNWSFKLCGEEYLKGLAPDVLTKETAFGTLGIQVLISRNGNTQAASMLTEGLLPKTLFKTKDEAFAAAFEKYGDNPRVTVRPIMEVLLGIAPEEMKDDLEATMDDPMDVPCMVAQLGHTINGASWIAFEESSNYALRTAAKRLGATKLAIVPSSNQEILINAMPDDREGFIKDVLTLIRINTEVNTAEVGIDEQIFNGVILYDTKTRLYQRVDEDGIHKPVRHNEAMQGMPEVVCSLDDLEEYYNARFDKEKDDNEI